jgi:hypothetical protein
MPSSRLKEKIREKIRSKLRERNKKERKKTEGQVNIEGVSKPKKRKPKKVKEQEQKKHKPASVSVGARGGRFIQEASGHKRYVKDGGLAGHKKISKSLLEELESIVKEDKIKEFVLNFKRRQ